VTHALVTGANGFIGANIVRDLLQRGIDVRALCRSGSDRSALDGLSIDIVEGDVRDPRSLDAAMAGCSLVFHAAALYSFWVRPRRLIYDINVGGTTNVLDAALRAGVEKVVYTSSVAAVGHRPDGKPADETAIADPASVVGDYKQSKLQAEAVAVSYADRLPVVIVNPSFPVGPWDTKPTPTGRTVLDVIERRMPAYLDTAMNVVDAEDVAAGHWLAAQRGRVGERYILGGENVTMKDLVTIVAELAGVPVPRVCLPRAPILALAYVNALWRMLSRSRRAPRMTPDTVRMSATPMVFDASKAVEELGFPRTAARDALRKAVDWFVHGFARQA